MDLYFLLNSIAAQQNSIKLIVMSGESNSGGYANNADCSADELLPRPALKIFNPYTNIFQDMQIGVNNLLDQYGFVDNSSHSWENGLANQASNGTINNPTFLVKAGQGGSVIANWNTGGTFSNKFNSRVTTALSLLGIINEPKFALLYSQGINDRLDGGWNATTWKNSTIARFNYLRTQYGDFPIVMTKFTTTYPELDSPIDDICAAVTNCYSIVTGDASLRDVNHWDYAGQKLIAGRMITTLKNQGYNL